jgi:hypothetical protein
VLSYGADSTGGTDARTAIGSAATAAIASGGHVYFPAGTYKLSGLLALSAGAYYYAPSGVNLLQYGAIDAANDSTWDGGDFKCYGTSIGYRFGTVTNSVHGATLQHASFSGGSTTDYSWARIQQRRGYGNTIHGNTCTSVNTGTAGIGQNIQLLGGHDTTITDNTTVGGITGIIHLWTKQHAGSGADSCSNDNIITGNTCSGMREEGISLDCQMNSADTNSFEYTSVGSVSGQDVTLTEYGSAYQDYTAYDLCFMTGALAGKTRTITGQSGAKNHVFTVTGDLTGLAAGDTLVVGAPYKNVTVAHNNVWNTTGYVTYLLFGLCYGCVVEYNESSYGKVDIRAIDSLAKATGQVCGNYGRAPNGYNTIRYNTMSDSPGSWGVASFYYNYTTNASASGYSAFQSKGHNIYGNTAEYVYAAQSDFYKSANVKPGGGDSTYTDGGGNTVEASAFTYDGGG